jgi:hypothetical protein
MMMTVPFFLFVAATLYSGLRYFGNHSVDHGFQAGGTSTNDQYDEDKLEHKSYYDTAIFLMLTSGLASVAQRIIWIWTLPGGGRHKATTVPVNIDFVIHRYGEWVMLLLGESILSLLIVEVTEGSDYYFTLFAGVLSVICYN